MIRIGFLAAFLADSAVSRPPKQFAKSRKNHVFSAFFRSFPFSRIRVYSIPGIHLSQAIRRIIIYGFYTR
jgi:hypothetical protein